MSAAADPEMGTTEICPSWQMFRNAEVLAALDPSTLNLHELS
jgi:hypothetical protein